MTKKKVLVVGIDGFQKSYADKFAHPFWEKIKDDCAVGMIPCPEDIESGQTGTASSPRLWSMLSTGCGTETNHILGFWEKKTADGEYIRADVDLEWIRKTRCEKLVNRNDLGVKPYWTVLLEHGYSIGMVTVWFSYPLTDDEQELIDETGSWVLTDFQYPREDLEHDRNVYPASAEPPEDFEDQVGAGARLPILVSREPEELVRRMKKQDKDRFDYAVEQLKNSDPDVLGLYLRGTDGFQHILKNQERAWREEGRFVQEGESIDESFADPDDLKDVYDINMDGIEALWSTGKFDVLVIVSDHGSGVLDGGPAHEWPAYVILYGDDVPPIKGLDTKYEDLVPTILDYLDADIPEWLEGDSLRVQLKMTDHLKKLGYF